MQSQQSQQQDLQIYSILTLNAKIEQFLVFYLHCYNKKSSICFTYDSRFSNLVIEGPTEQLLSFRKLFKNTLVQYKASQFNFGFSAAGVLNFVVGIIANRPKIKYFDLKKLQKINQLPNVRLQIEKKLTYMVGPKKEVEELLVDIAKFVVGAVAIGIDQAKKARQRAKLNAEAIDKIRELKKDQKSLEKKISDQKEKLKKKSQIQQNHPQSASKKVQDFTQSKQFKQSKQEISPKINPENIIVQPDIPPIDQIVPKKIELKEPTKIQQNKVTDNNEHKKTRQEEQFLSYFQFMNRYSKYYKKNQTIISVEVGPDIGSSDHACKYIQSRILENLKFNLGEFVYKRSERKQNSILLYGQVPNQSYEKVVQEQIHKNFQNISVSSINLDIKDEEFFSKIKQVKDFKIFISDDNKKLLHIFPKNISAQKIMQYNSIIKQLLIKYSNDRENVLKQTVIKYTNASDIKSKLQNFTSLASSIINNSPSKLSNVIPKNSISTSNLPNNVPVPNPVHAPDPNLNLSKIQSSKIVKRQFNFSYLIGQQLWKYIEELSDQYLQININFNAISKFSGRVNYIHIYQPNNFFAKGPQSLMVTYSQKLREKIKLLKQKKSVRCFEISEQTYKKMIQESAKMKYFQKNSGKGSKIITNPQIAPLFFICQTKLIEPNRRYEILGVRASDCDLFIDSLGTLLLFNMKKDYDYYRKTYKNIDSLIQDQFYSILSICELDSQDSFIDFIKQNAKDYSLKKDQSQCEKLKIFVFAELNELRLLIWSLIQIINILYQKKLQIFLVFRDEDQHTLSAEGIPDRYKKWYTKLKNDQTFYTYEGVMAINKAEQSNPKEIILNSDHVEYDLDTHQADLKNKTFTHLKYGEVIHYRDMKDLIQFDYKGKVHRLASSCYQSIRAAEQNNQDKMNLSISLLHVDIEKQVQTNLWNGYSRQMKYKEISLQSKNLMISNECSKHILQVIVEEQKQHEKIKNGIMSHFCIKSIQSLKLKNLKDAIKIDKLQRLCCSNQIEIINLSQTNLQVNFQIGNIGVQIVRKYVDMINNQEYVVVYPQYWSNDPTLKNYTEFVVGTYEKEFKDIQKVFPYQINKLLRIQNQNAFTRYFHEMKFLEKINGGKKIKQMLLYHGTRLMDPSVLTADKQMTFNINYSADKNYMGRATYFAQQATYSNNYRYKLSPTVGVMLICRVLVGDSQKCPRLQVNYLDTEFKDKEKTIKYESMTDFYDGSQIYTVYRNNRAYPLYRVEYIVK